MGRETIPGTLTGSEKTPGPDTKTIEGVIEAMKRRCEDRGIYGIPVHCPKNRNFVISFPQFVLDLGDERLAIDDPDHLFEELERILDAVK